MNKKKQWAHSRCHFSKFIKHPLAVLGLIEMRTQGNTETLWWKETVEKKGCVSSVITNSFLGIFVYGFGLVAPRNRRVRKCQNFIVDKEKAWALLNWDSQ